MSIELEEKDKPSYRGYDIRPLWIPGGPTTTDHWVHRVYFGREWIDSFLTLDQARREIDHWLEAP